MKKQLLLLVSILLPLISSCNVEPTEKPTVEPSEEIYYLDGLASNLFVDTFNKEFMNYYYVGNHQAYNIKILDFSNEEISKLYIPNIINEKKRLVDVSWDITDTNNPIYHIVYIQITATDRPNLLVEIINTFSQAKIMIQSINGTVSDKTSLAIFNLIIKVKDAIQLNDVFNFVNNIPGVLEVERITKN